MEEKRHTIHPTAVVDPRAELGDGVVIGAFATIEGNCFIGDDTIIHPHAIIRSGARIGKRCQIHPFAVVAGEPQDLKFRGEETLAIIGDNTTIREYVTINRGTSARGKTVVGSDCLVMAYCHVAHDCQVGNHVILGNITQLAGEVEIDDYANVGGGSLVHQFVRISKQVMIQGGSRVTKDIPPYVLAGREPLIYCGLNVVGLRRRNYTEEQMDAIHEAYRIIYMQGLNRSDALEAIAQQCKVTEEIALITSFIQQSQRGVLKGGIQ